MIKISNEQETTELGLSHQYQLNEDLESPLAFFVHGRAGDQRVMWTFRRALPDSYSLVAPQAPLSDPIGGFSWWMVQGSRVDSRAAAEQAAGALFSFMTGFISRHHLRPRHIVACGFSQGAGLLSLVMQREPGMLRGVALLAGFVLEMPEFPAMRELPKVFIAHGSQDEVVPVARAEEGASYLRSRGFEVAMSVDAVGHKVGASSMRALKEWIAAL